MSLSTDKNHGDGDHEYMTVWPGFETALTRMRLCLSPSVSESGCVFYFYMRLKRSVKALCPQLG